MKNYLDQLDNSQREAVVYDGGPSLVVAGAGSGKTRVLTYKIIHLLQNGYQPHAILALTFTNKAAREMKHRIASIINEYTTRYLWMGTFHSIFYRILRREAQYIGYPANFTIYDQTDSKNLIKTVLKELLLDEKVYRPNMVQHRISHAKNALISCNAYVANAKLIEEDRRSNTPLIGEVYKMYQSRCFHAGAMDFDDLLLYTNILFRDHADVLAKYQRQFRYVLVDEYQDTNFAQHLIVSRLCENHHNVFVVGDDAQSIYSFRGANIDNMLRFKENYPDCRMFKLEQNYRSTQNIVDAANSLIEKNKEQIKKKVFSTNEKGNKITVLSSYSDYEEGYIVATKIWEMKQQSGYSFSDFAILYRTNAQSRVLEEALRKRMISYKVYGALSFYQRKEIKDVLAYLRVIVNPKDEESLKRIINYPLRGIGQTTVDKLLHAAIASHVSLWDVIGSLPAYSPDISKGTAEKIKQFKALIDELQTNNNTMNASEIGTFTVKRSGIQGDFLSDKSVDGISRLENVNELLSAMNEFVALRLEEGVETISLTDFLMEVSLLTDQDNDKDEFTDKVTMMTVHSAKGLEYKNVFVVGMENDLFPSSQAGSPKAVEEERRLFYVAITRAKENCIITYATNRFRNGTVNIATPSYFIDDIDELYLDYPDDIELPDNRWESSEVKNPAWDSDDGYSYTNKYSRMNNRSKVESENNRWRSVRSFGTETERPVSKWTGTSNAKQANTDSSGVKWKETEAPKVKPTKTITSLAGFSVGDKVVHDRFGEGVVLSLEGRDSDAKASVDFTNTGTKQLLLKYAKLKLLP
jgi:DNA helicase-2/ATP-dependent DNA helicase PcrA